MQWGGRDSSRSLAFRNAEFASSLRQHVPGRASAKQRALSGGRQRSVFASNSVSPRRPAKATEPPARPESNCQSVNMRETEKQHCSLQQELDESMSELAIVQRRCHSLEESLAIAESQHVKARSMNSRLKERLQLFQDQNAENCRIAEMEISKLTARLAAAEATICRLQDENNSLDEAVRAQGKELEFLRDAKEVLQSERDDAFRGGQKLEESLRELARDFETLSDKYEYERRESQEAKLQLTELMEVSLSQSAKLEVALQKLDRCHEVELAAAEFREGRLLQRWLPLWKVHGPAFNIETFALESHFTCQGHSLCEQFCKTRKPEAILLRDTAILEKDALRLEEACSSLTMKRHRRLQQACLAGLHRRLILAYSGNRVAGLLQSRTAKGAFAEWRGVCNRKLFALRWARLEIPRERLCRAAFDALHKNRTRNQQGRRLAQLLGEYLPKAGALRGFQWFRTSVECQRAEAMCRLAIQHLRWRARQRRVLNLAVAAAAGRQKRLARAIYRDWNSVAVRSIHTRQVSENIACRRSFTILRRVLLAWVFRLLESPVTRQAKGNEERLQQALQKTASLSDDAFARSLLRSQEERITVLEATEQTGTTKLRRLEALIEKRDDEIDRLRRDIKLLEEINHKLRLTSVLEPLTETVTSSPRSSEAGSRSFSASE
ncbi:hypothetical protein FOL47_007562 [Perkinsus chesapeaki]|uniref:Uncharacterized protein n=1 Tax=Perkinsus chesapeaki TaxID=330153 RepID=A0A7J6LJP0_PERCH|nr:hypothetical protein FOL47_007562 [Perkinsus chesapeaki]